MTLKVIPFRQYVIDYIEFLKQALLFIVFLYVFINFPMISPAT